MLLGSLTLHPRTPTICLPKVPLFLYLQNFGLPRCEFCNEVYQDLPFDRGSGPILNIKSSQRGPPLSYPSLEI